MTEVVMMTVTVALLAAFILSLLIKWEVVEWLQVHGSDLISKMANCDFCLSFWICVAVSAVMMLLTGAWWLVAVPVMATPITRRLL